MLLVTKPVEPVRDHEIQELGERPLTGPTPKCPPTIQEESFNMMGELQNLAQRSRADVALITETHLREAQRPFIRGYKIYRKDRAPHRSPPSQVKENDRSPLAWTSGANLSFATCKEALRNATRLGHPNTEADLSYCDASDVGVGAVLQQLTEGAWEPSGFFSRSLSRTERQYSTYDSSKSIRTTSPSRLPSVNHTLMLRRAAPAGQFMTDILFLAGYDNPVADALSRIERLGLPNALDIITQAAQKSEESVVTRLLRESGKLKWLHLPEENYNTLNRDASCLPTNCTPTVHRRRIPRDQSPRRPLCKEVRNKEILVTRDE
ncbi:hypothetical protein AAG570_002726 [Ranatra chinensis]|uniref:Reverse transcriptase/retrotransposon-derived protein RNase H-like domain-containing protein n=1 Tax=Ranatra chinensis TaxID=642074 RepID=A0ABD0Y8G9_9HEMI